jgi:hypothetical protein
MAKTIERYIATLDTILKGTQGIGSVAHDFPDPGTAPTQTDLLAFLLKLEAALHWETKKDGTGKDAAQVAKRSAALKKIISFVNDGTKQGRFLKVDKYLFAFQLAIRARSPRLVDQKNTLLCGPAALVYDLAKRDPDKYVEFAISLFHTGCGTLNGAQITPSTKILRGYSAGLLPEADYVVLASLRETNAIAYSSEFLRNLLSLTKPGALCEFLTRAGYSNVEDHTFLNLSMPLKLLNAVTPFPLNAVGHDPFDKGEQNLKQAQDALVTQGHLVIMNADSAVAKAVMKRELLDKRTGSLPADATHWTAIRKLEFKPNNVVNIKLMTWGGSYEHTLDKDALLSRYGGYVSAKP